MASLKAVMAPGGSPPRDIPVQDSVADLGGSSADKPDDECDFQVPHAYVCLPETAQTGRASEFELLGGGGEWTPCAFSVSEDRMQLAMLPESGGTSCECFIGIPLERVLDVTLGSSPSSASIQETVALPTHCVREKSAGRSCRGSGSPSRRGRAAATIADVVALGTFDLPPIPLARLPESSAGLPSTDPQERLQQRMSQRHSSAFQRRLRRAEFALQEAEKHWGVPLREYDGSNCPLHEALNPSLPPLPPSHCRLPQRTHRELRTTREAQEGPGDEHHQGAESSCANASEQEEATTATGAAPVASVSILVAAADGSDCPVTLLLQLPSDKAASQARRALLRWRSELADQ